MPFNSKEFETFAKSWDFQTVTGLLMTVSYHASVKELERNSSKDDNGKNTSMTNEQNHFQTYNPKML